MVRLILGPFGMRFNELTEILQLFLVNQVEGCNHLLDAAVLLRSEPKPSADKRWGYTWVFWVARFHRAMCVHVIRVHRRSPCSPEVHPRNPTPRSIRRVRNTKV